MDCVLPSIQNRKQFEMDPSQFNRITSTGWPPSSISGPTLRAMATRRRRMRQGAASVATVAALAGGAVIWQLVLATVPSENVVATTPGVGGGTVSFRDVTISLPNGWGLDTETPTEATACLRPPGEQEVPCLVQLTVAQSPRAGLTTGVDVVAAMTENCEDEDPRDVSVRHFEVNDRKASAYSGRCTDTSPTVYAWALDNRTMYMMTQREDLVEAVESAFRTVSVPTIWPEPTPSVIVTESPNG